jgi:hypothetical protein
LEAAFKQIDLLMEQLYILSETSAAAFGQLKAGLAESGTALKPADDGAIGQGEPYTHEV